MNELIIISQYQILKTYFVENMQKLVKNPYKFQLKPVLSILIYNHLLTFLTSPIIYYA